VLHGNYLAGTTHGFSRPRCKQWKCDTWKYRYVLCFLVEASLTEGLDSSEEEQLPESIITDNNGGQPIVINSSDEEMDDENSRPNPQRRVQRKRVPPHSPEMVNWTSKEYETRSAVGLTAAWGAVWKQWASIYTNPDRQLGQILDRFHEIMCDVRRYELWNEKYRKRDGRRAYRAWQMYRKNARKQLQATGDKGLVRGFGRALKRLQEAEEEYQSIAVTMNDGDSEDCDYVPTQTRRHR
jgi:hypothetical protein